MFKKRLSLLQTLPGKGFLYLTMLAILIGLGSNAFFLGLKVKGQSETKDNLSSTLDSNQKSCSGCAAKGEQGIYIPLMNLPETEGSQIVFNSRSPHAMDVTPVFYTADGTVIAGDPVSINALEIRYVDLKTLIPAEYRTRQDWGGLSLKYYGGNREMWAQFRFLGVNGGNNVDEFFIVENEQRSDVQAATWWTPPGSTSVIVLGNVTGDSTSALVQFGSGQTQTVSLAPHATMVIRKPQASQKGETSESVTITITGPAGSIIPTGLIEAANHNSNSVIRFYDTKSAKQANLYGNGLELKNAIPRMVLNNTSSNPIVATPKFIPTTGITANPILLPPVNLEPNETLEVNLAPLMDAVKKRKDLDVVSVEVNNNGDSGSLIGALYTMEKGSDFSYDIPLRDSGPVRTMTGSYPWKVDDDYSTVVYITNITDLPQEFVGQVNFEGGTFGMKPRRLAPGETAEIDLRKLRDEQKTDDLKRQIPKNIENGQFRWATHGKTGGKLALIGRAVMKSKSNRIMTSYSCNDPCPPSYSGFLSPPLLRLSIGESGLMTAWEEGHYDQGYDYPSSFGPYQVGGSWSVDSIDSSSMIVDGTGATFTGISPGTTNVFVIIGEYQSYVYDGRDCYDNNYTYIISDGGPVETLCAVPTNFVQLGAATDIGGGELRFEYAYDSSTGRLADLSACTVGEIVTYPGTGNYTPPAPFNNIYLNPTILNIPAYDSENTNGRISDTQRYRGSFTLPLSPASFTATQYFRYKCPCMNNGNYVNLAGPLSIVRSVSRSSSTGKYIYTVTKSGYSATKALE
jgi:hypothetical protein